METVSEFFQQCTGDEVASPDSVFCPKLTTTMCGKRSHMSRIQVLIDFIEKKHFCDRDISANNFKENIQIINTKSDLKLLTNNQYSIKFVHNFNEELNSGDIPGHVKCIYFNFSYNKEIQQNVLPSDLEILILGLYQFHISRDILPSKLWFLSNESGPIIDLLLYPENDSSDSLVHIFIKNNFDGMESSKKSISDGGVNQISNALTINNLIVFTCNTNDPHCVSFDIDFTTDEYVELLDKFNIQY